VRNDEHAAPSAPRVCVFAPSPILTVTIEQGTHDGGELHVHPGGQGFWVARMLRILGATPVLCAPLGGETGDVFGHLLAAEELELRIVEVTAATGAYLHDRRDGERQELWHAPLGPLGRHEIDDLFTVTLAAGLEAGVCVLSGTHRQEGVLREGTFARLSADLRANGVAVLADLQGSFLREALEGGLEVVKVSEDELVEDGWATGPGDEEVIAGLKRLVDAGAREVVVSRAAGGAIALLGGKLLRATGPEMTAVDPAGAGDSMTAALAFARTTGMEPVEALRLAVGAGAMNVTRHGLGSGEATAIAQLAGNVQVETIGGDES
jgi:1-phosphofructokinase